MLPALLGIILTPSLLIAEPFDMESHKVYHYYHPKLSKSSSITHFELLSTLRLDSIAVSVFVIIIG